MSTFKELLSQYSGIAYAKRLAFNEYLGDVNWSLDMTTGMVSFGHDHEYPFQLLGTESFQNSTWLWAWANQENPLPAERLKLCKALRQRGEKEHVPELTMSQIPLSPTTGYALSLFAAGLNITDCFYRASVPGGALYFIVNRVQERVVTTISSEQVVITLSEVLSNFDVDHQLMVKSFLTSQSYSIQVKGSSIQAQKGAHTLFIDFDSEGKIRELGSKEN